MYKYNFTLSGDIPTGYELHGFLEELHDLNNDYQLQIDIDADLLCFVTDEGSYSSATETALSGVITSHDKDVKKLNKAIRARKVEVEDYRNNLFFQDFVYDSSTFQGAREDLENLKEASNLCNTFCLAKIIDPEQPDFSVSWILKDNSVRVLDSTDMGLIVGYLSIKKQTLWHEARTIKQAIEALTTVSAVNSYDITQGWSY